MFKENHYSMVLKFIMNKYSPLLCITFFVILCNFSFTKKEKHRRLSGIRDEIYVPSLINFELKGKSLAWVPVRLTGSDIQPSNDQLKKIKLRKSRYVEEGSCDATSSPKKIFDALEDVDDPDSGIGEGNGSFEMAGPIDDYEIDTESPEVKESTVSESVQTTSEMSDRTTAAVDDSTETTQPFLSTTEGPLTDYTEEDTITVILGTGTCFIKEHRRSSNIPTEGVKTESPGVEHTLKLTSPQKMEAKDEYLEEDEEKGKNATTGKETVLGSITSFTTKLALIETPPRPRRPLNLNFPTCSGNDDYLEIEPPLFGMYPTHPPTGHKSKIKEKWKHRLRSSSHHTVRQIATTLPAISTTPVKSNKTQPTTTQAIPPKKHQGSNRKEGKVLVRIPPSLSELPVVVLRDPKTKILSLSLVSGEQQTIKPSSYSNKYKPFYYPQQPFSYQQMLPPPFPYNNIYFPNYPSMNKLYPYWYMYDPNIMNSRNTYAIPNKQKHRDYVNNIRLIRDTYYEDEDDERNFTKSN